MAGIAVPGADLIGILAGYAFGDRKSNLVGHFLRFVAGIYAGGDDFNAERLKRVALCFDSSKLLLAIRSPMSPVEDDKPILAVQVTGQRDGTAAHEIECHLWEG
jgi:hypothetical protein